MRVHFFQHVPFEGLGSIGAWLEERRLVVTGTRFFEEPLLPETEAIDLLIVMGGPMSVNDGDHHPWLHDERRFIAEMIRQGKAVLGVCLGAQLIASALGADVYPNRTREIGWFPVRRVHPPDGDPRGKGRLFRFPEECLVFHWHGETFDLPPGAVRLAESEACPNQAFQYGRRVIGLQFHLESTPIGVRDLVQNCGAELNLPGSVQPPEQILSVTGHRYGKINRLMADLLSFLVEPGL